MGSAGASTTTLSGSFVFMCGPSGASTFGSVVEPSLRGFSDSGPDTDSAGASTSASGLFECGFRSVLFACCFDLRALFLLVPRAEAALACARGDTPLPSCCLYAIAVAGTTAAIFPSSPTLSMMVASVGQ